jgi:acetoacetyl-CoA synthetase
VHSISSAPKRPRGHGLIGAESGRLLWQPTEEATAHTNLSRYLRWLTANDYGHFSTYADLWTWSVSELDRFWESVWQFHQVDASRSYRTVREGSEMPGTMWFPGAKLNYAQHLFRHSVAGQTALDWHSERTRRSISWAELEAETAALAGGLRDLGVTKGDRIVAVMPNLPETVVAFLAVASLGAIWSVCSPDFGLASLVDRFRQIAPSVLLAVDGYQYGGKAYDRRGVIGELQAALPSLRHTVLLPYLDPEVSTSGLDEGTVLWRDVLNDDRDLAFTPVDAEHPLWIVYTSGTTGLPKAIVHGHAGILVERLKAIVLQGDVKPEDRYFWYTTTGWVMWNLNVSALLGCSTIILYDGSPWYPDRSRLWRLAEEAGATIFGTSSAFLVECMHDGQTPKDHYDLTALRSIGATASPLPPDAFTWVYRNVKPEVWLAPASGGTDVATAFVGGSPTLPVYAGEIQCRSLGVDVRAFDAQGRECANDVGELVVLQPMPSMPLYFWDDPDNKRYHESYFATYPGIWCHGDWIRFTTRGTAVIEGRSDSTINRHGVRMGTSEIYRAVESVGGVADSLVVEVPEPGNASSVILFVVLESNVRLDAQLEQAIIEAVRILASPRHVPDSVEVIPEVPRTLNGKKLEVPVRRILSGIALDEALAMGSVANPGSLEYFVRRRDAG